MSGSATEIVDAIGGPIDSVKVLLPYKLGLLLVALAVTAAAAQIDDDARAFFARELFEQLGAVPVEGPGHCGMLAAQRNKKKQLDLLPGYIDAIMAGYGGEYLLGTRRGWQLRSRNDPRLYNTYTVTRDFSSLHMLTVSVNGATGETCLHDVHAVTAPDTVGSARPPTRYQVGQAAYDDGDYETAAEQWRLLAESGHGRARYDLGRLYFEGKGLDKNLPQAFRWMSLAASQGVSAAQYHVGYMYSEGLGTEQDLLRAYVWVGLAARQGNPHAAETQRKLAESMETAEIAAGRKEIKRWVATAHTVDGAEITRPKRIEKFYVPAQYPAGASADWRPGRVILQAMILVDGTVDELDIIACNRPGQGFEEAALKAVSAWRFEPATQDGNPVSAYYTVSVQFDSR